MFDSYFTSVQQPEYAWLLRSTEEMFLSVGARIGYYQGDVRKLVDDIAALKPTLFIGAHGSSSHTGAQQNIVKARDNKSPMSVVLLTSTKPAMLQGFDVQSNLTFAW